MSKIGTIKFGEDVNTNGISVSIYFTSCDFNCKNCFNKEFQNYNYGFDFTKEIKDNIFRYIDNNIDYIDNLAILGGEPLHINNINSVINLCEEFKLKFPNKNIWLWTGYEFENIPNKNIIDVTDYIIDGLFIESLKDKHLKYRGSNNQRIFKNGKLILDNEIDI